MSITLLIIKNLAISKSILKWCLVKEKFDINILKSNNFKSHFTQYTSAFFQIMDIQ